jgi:tRNA(Ile)-lysidine synthetase-like protein
MVRQAHHERNQQAHHERNQQVLHERHQQIQEERNQQTDHERNRQAVACNESFDFGQESAVEGLNQGTAKSWPTGQRSISLTQHQSLSWVESSSGILAEHWHTAHIEIKFRSGGEKISLPGRSGHHTLKKLFQEAGIPPWERELMPLIYLNGQLAAIGEQWVSADFYGEKVGACISLHWQRQVTGPKDNDEVVVVD